MNYSARSQNRKGLLMIRILKSSLYRRRIRLKRSSWRNWRKIMIHWVPSSQSRSKMVPNSCKSWRDSHRRSSRPTFQQILKVNRIWPWWKKSSNYKRCMLKTPSWKRIASWNKSRTFKSSKPTPHNCSSQNCRENLKTNLKMKNMDNN